MLKSYFGRFVNSIKESVPLIMFFIIFPWKMEGIYRFLESQLLGVPYKVIAMVLISMVVYFVKRSIRRDVDFHSSAVTSIFIIMIFELSIYNTFPVISDSLRKFRETESLSIAISVSSLMYFLYKSIMQKDQTYPVDANRSYGVLLISFIFQMAFLELAISRFFSGKFSTIMKNTNISTNSMHTSLQGTWILRPGWL